MFLHPDPNVGTSQSVETENQDNQTDGPSEDNEGADGVSSEGEKQAVEVEVSNITQTHTHHSSINSFPSFSRRRVAKQRPHRRRRTHGSARCAVLCPHVVVGAAPLCAATITTTPIDQRALCGSVTRHREAEACVVIPVVSTATRISSICLAVHPTAIAYSRTVLAVVDPCGVQDQTTSMPVAEEVVTRERRQRRRSLLAQADYNPYTGSL